MTDSHHQKLYGSFGNSQKLETISVRVYRQTGPELSFDHQKNNAFEGPKLSESDEVKIGITPGVGILLNISGISLGAHGKAGGEKFLKS